MLLWLPSKRKESYFTLLAKSRKRTGRLLVLILLAVGAFAIYSFYSYSQSPLRQGIGPLGSAHIHQGVAIYIDGARLNLALASYQSQDSYTHFENGEGVTVHIHATGIRLEYVLSTLRLLDKGPFAVILNGQTVSDGVKYEPKDGDRILISNSPDLANIQWAEVANELSSWSPPTGGG